MELFKAIIKDRWSETQNENLKLKRILDTKIHDLEEKKEKLVSAYIYEKSIGQEIYQEQMKKITKGIEAVITEQATLRPPEKMDVEGVLNFAEKSILNADHLWTCLPSEGKLKFQRVLFPTGITFDGSTFGTVKNDSIFNYLSVFIVGNKKMASPTGFEPVLQA